MPSIEPTSLDHIPLFDHHAHPWLRNWQRLDILAFRSCFSESPSAALVQVHLAQSLPYRRALRELAAILACAPTEEAILAVRQRTSAPDYLQRLFARANLEHLLLDDGFPPSSQALSVEEVGAAGKLPVGRVLRIETLVQDLTVAVETFADLVAAFDTLVGDVRGHGIVALKSIAAYRSGLRLTLGGDAAAAAAWKPLREEARRVGSIRLTAKPVIDFFVLRALGHAARQGIACQFHTGYGDPDLDLREANPLHLRPVLEDRDLREAKVVLLHGAYPYTREGAYLAAVYPQVHLDVSTSLPPLGATEIEATLSQALGVAPASKVLLSSDGARIPEHHMVGAQMARRALCAVLRRAIAEGELAPEETERFAAWPLHRTARSVYGVLPGR